MKYRKVELTPRSLGLINDRIAKLMLSGISKIKHAWGNLNPTTNKTINWNHYPNDDVYMPQSTLVSRILPTNQLFIRIPSNHRTIGATVFKMGDVFYIGKDVILVKSGMPDVIVNEILLTKICLLSRYPYSSSAVKAYKKSQRYYSGL